MPRVLVVGSANVDFTVALSRLPQPGETVSGGTLLVANKTDRTLSVIDTVAGKQTHAVPEDGPTGHEVTASPDGKVAYVPIYGDSGVGRPGSDGKNMMVIDIASGKKELWKELLPPDPAGVTTVSPVVVTSDRKSYAYSYQRSLADLYVVEGLK